MSFSNSSFWKNKIQQGLKKIEKLLKIKFDSKIMNKC